MIRSRPEQRCTECERSGDDQTDQRTRFFGTAAMKTTNSTPAARAANTIPATSSRHGRHGIQACPPGLRLARVSPTSLVVVGLYLCWTCDLERTAGVQPQQ